LVPLHFVHITLLQIVVSFIVSFWRQYLGFYWE